MSRLITTVIALSLAALPAAALADSIHLEVSPAMPPRGSTITIKATGEAITGDEIVLGASGGETSPCRQPLKLVEGFFEGLTEQLWPVAGVFEDTFTYSLQELGHSPSPFCGYISKGGVEHEVTTAFAELPVVYGPSASELAQKEREKREREERARDQEQAERERKSQEEQLAAERAKAQLEAEAPARKAAEAAAEKAKLEAEESTARAFAHKKRIRHLRAWTRAVYGRSSQFPGETWITIDTDPFSYVTVKLTRYGHVTLGLEWGAQSESTLVWPWRCSGPGGVYKYEVRARRDGASKIARGSFAAVTPAYCRKLKREEAEARRRETKRFAEEDAREAERKDARQKRWEERCRNEHGTPTWEPFESGSELWCVGPTGGHLIVPEER